jgi:hypothetical protein
MATNTSSIMIEDIAAALDTRSRLIGIHFFNPVAQMPLVEVIRGEKTGEEAIARTVAYALAMGKKPIVVNDCPGFLVNRILSPYLGAFIGLVKRGIDFITIDRAMERPIFGWGSWGRNQLYNSAGEITTTTDGRWIITIGVYGWAGFIAEFGLLLLPIFLVWWRVSGQRTEVPPWIGGTVLILAINVIDMVPNATLTPMSWLFAGALLGYCEQVQGARIRAQLPPLRTVL